jgi:hypothetical protein
MPAEIISEPLAVVCVFSSAERYTVRLHKLPCQSLVADLALGLAGLVHPHGSIDRASTISHYRTAIGRLAGFCDGAGLHGGAAQLSRARLIEFLLRCDHGTESATRRMLRCFDARTGRLRPEVREYLDGEFLHRQPRKRPLAPYSDAEWNRIIGCCRTVIRAHWQAQQAAVAEAMNGQDPAVGGWSPGNMLWLQHHHGPWGKQQVADHMGCSTLTVWKHADVPAAARALYPTLEVAFAYRLLLGMTTGIVPDGLDDLGLDDIDWAGDTAILLDYVKARTGPQSLRLSSTAVRVLRRWLTHSQRLRRNAPETLRSRLWLAYTIGSPVHAALFDHETVHAFVARNGLLGDDGEPLHLHRSRLRVTYLNRLDKSAWTGRTTIDPNHSAQVEGDHYLSQPTAAQRDALETVIEDAQSDLLRQATTATVLDDQGIVAAAALLPARVASLRLSDTALAELLAGQRDVFTAACADQLAGLHGPAGRPCPARPWVCLLCPLAVFAPRHAANLLRLKAFFARQFRQMPLAQFTSVFGAYAHRLDADILPQFSPAVLAAAAQQVSGSDAELPLRAEEVTFA